MNINFMRNKITLLNIKKIENDEGFVFEQKEVGPDAWVFIKQVSGKNQKFGEKYGNLPFSKILGTYKIVMQKNFNRNARHAYHNALRWNHKILTIVNSLQEDPSGRWIQLTAVDCGMEEVE